MRKVQLLAVFWTLVLAIPLTVLALSAVAFITEHLFQISTAVASLGRAIVIWKPDWLFESEVVGMVAGQVIILAVLMLTFATGRREEKE
jgi:hypothetical protein